MDKLLENTPVNTLENTSEDKLKQNKEQSLLGKKVLISAGGTGGHVYPALVIAKSLAELGAKISWIGTDAGIESRLVPENNITLHKIFVQGVRGNGLKRLLKAPFVIIKAVFAAMKIIKKVQPDIYIGFGGFVTGPAGIAAKLKGVPIVLHEQNAAMGFTNKAINKISKKTLLAFPINSLKSNKIKVVGNPVRESISNLELPELRICKGEFLNILILGGSLGAQRINQTIPLIINKLNQLNCSKKIKVLHQTGIKTHEETLGVYKDNNILTKELENIKVEVVPYLENIDEAYKKADIIIARAGALTVSEIASAGIAAIFIPIPYAVDNHQFLNAKYISDNGGAVILEQKDLNENSLYETLTNLLEGDKLLNMAIATRKMTHKSARIEITKEIVSIINSKK